MKKYGKLAVFAGGISNEREISLLSGKAVYKALKRKNQDVSLIDIKSDFREKLKKITYDIIFLALHGSFGEDGTVQRALEERGIPYTGSDVFASSIAMDKVASRKAFITSSLKAPRYKIAKDAYSSACDEFKPPLVVKPQCGGSSIGLSIVNKRREFKKALEKAFKHGDRVIVEEYIEGKELTVGILEEKALPVIEIVTKHNTYDYEAKYLDEETEYRLPAGLEKTDYKKTQEVALKAYRAIGCRDFSRVDMRMDRKGDLYVLEVNTIPGMTERSLLPKAARASGISFEDLCIKLVDLAYKRRK